MTTLAEALQLKIDNHNRTQSEPEHLNKHYKVGAMQPWDIIDEWDLDFYEGNVLKYLLRARHKGSQLDDYIKAKHYLQRLIDKCEHEDPLLKEWANRIDLDKDSW